MSKYQFPPHIEAWLEYTLNKHSTSELLSVLAMYQRILSRQHPPVSHAIETTVARLRSVEGKLVVEVVPEFVTHDGMVARISAMEWRLESRAPPLFITDKTGTWKRESGETSYRLLETVT